MMKKSEGRPRRLSVKKQAVKTGGEGRKRPQTGRVARDVDRIRYREREKGRDVDRIRQREREKPAR
jgi:hypothetical protein